MIKEYKADNNRLSELYKLALDRLFGKKAEKIEVVPDGQLSFFEEIRNAIADTVRAVPMKNASLFLLCTGLRKLPKRISRAAMPKPILEMLMPGPKPKPVGFKEPD